MEMVQVSILLPTYNRGYILSRAIESVFKQTFLFWELIIIDDGSVDNTKEVVKKYLSDERIKFFSISHVGQMSALNFGYKKSKSKIISFLDSDDWYDEKHLQTGCDYLRDHSEVEFVTTKLNVIGDQFVVDMKDNNNLINIEDCNPQGTFFVRRHVVDKLCGFPEVDYGSDYIFYNLAKESQINIHNLNDRTYYFDRTGSTSITKNKIKELGL